MAEDFVRDKDAVSACCMIAEIVAFAKQSGKTFYRLLLDIYSEFGLYYEGLISLTKKGKSGLEEIQGMMDNYRKVNPTSINNQKVIRIKDYQTLIDKDILNNTSQKINLPVSNVLQFLLEDGTLITVRPSGTEPKIKFYFGVKAELIDTHNFKDVEASLKLKIEEIKKSMNLV